MILAYLKLLLKHRRNKHYHQHDSDRTQDLNSIKDDTTPIFLFSKKASGIGLSSDLRNLIQFKLGPPKCREFQVY